MRCDVFINYGVDCHLQSVGLLYENFHGKRPLKNIKAENFVKWLTGNG